MWMLQVDSSTVIFSEEHFLANVLALLFSDLGRDREVGASISYLKELQGEHEIQLQAASTLVTGKPDWGGGQ